MSIELREWKNCQGHHPVGLALWYVGAIHFLLEQGWTATPGDGMRCAWGWTKARDQDLMVFRYEIHDAIEVELQGKAGSPRTLLPWEASERTTKALAFQRAGMLRLEEKWTIPMLLERLLDLQDDAHFSDSKESREVTEAVREWFHDHHFVTDLPKPKLPAGFRYRLAYPKSGTVCYALQDEKPCECGGFHPAEGVHYLTPEIYQAMLDKHYPKK
jgi:hypothetical protein